MPAFSNVLVKVLESSSIDKVVIVFFVKNKVEFKLNSKYSEKLRCLQIQYSSNFGLLLKAPFVILWLSYIALKWKIKLIYGHGAIGAIGGILALLTRKKFIQRIYGSFLIDEIENSKFSILLRHPLDYMSFVLPSHNTIITNDGTHGDLVFKKLNQDFSRMKFMLNGVNKSEGISRTRSPKSKPLMTYIARLDIWKRAHLFAEAAAILKKEYELEFEALIIGPIVNESYAKEIQSIIESNGLTNQIKILGAVTASEAKQYMIDSTLTCSFYQTSNLGNVFLESLTLGVPILAINCNNSLGEVDSGAYEVCTDSPSDIAYRMNVILKDEAKRLIISENARKWSDLNLNSWNKRAEMELQVIQKLLDD